MSGKIIGLARQVARRIGSGHANREREIFPGRHVTAWMDTTPIDLSEQLAQLSAQLRLLNATLHPRPQQQPSPWLPLREAAQLLHLKSPRALKARILRGGFPPDCYRQIASGKRHYYLVNVERYLKTLR